MAKERRRERKVEWPKKNGGEQPPAAKPVPPAKPPAAQPVQPVKPPAAQPVQPVKPPTAKPVQPAKPPAAKPVQPVKPPAARPVQPVKPPAARPVQPVKPPAARPVQPVKPPAARPVAPTTALPVAPPVAPPTAAPVAAPMAKPVDAAPARGKRGGTSSRRGARPMDEEEIGRSGHRGGRGGRSSRPSGGMGIAAKTALVTGLTTLLVMALALLAGGGAPDAEKAMDDAGYAAVQALSRTHPKWWAGDVKTDALKETEKIFAALFGQKGRDFWDERKGFIDTPFPDTTEWDPEDIADLKTAKNAWNEATDKYGAGAKTGDAGKDAADILARLARPGGAISQKQGYVIVGAWIKNVEGATVGKYLASYPTGNQIVYDETKLTAVAKKVKGTVAGKKVSIYVGDLPRASGTKGLRAYVALARSSSAPKPAGSKLGIVLAILAPFLVGAVAFAVAGAHAKNVRALGREIDRLGTSGDPTRTLRPQGGDAAFVARAVERMVGNLEFRSKHDDEDLDQIAEKEHKVAEEIHDALMSNNPPRLSNYEVETLYKPGFEIAGDHFEYFPIDETHLGVILLDTNVRGIPAALVMASARSYVRAAAPRELSPAAVLREVNRHLAGDLPPGRHVTALYVVIDTKEGKATIASAGHLPLIVYRHAGGKVAKVNPEGIALGLDAGPVFDRSLQEGDIPIGVGDRIVLYTDGALKIQNEFGEEFGETRFYEAVSREAPKNSQAFINFVGGGIDQFHLNAPQNDDITISTVKRLR